MIVVLTQDIDFTADFVIEEMNRRDIEFIRFDTGHFPLASTLVASHLQADWAGSISFRGRKLDFSSITSIWYRRPTRFRVRPDLELGEKKFAEAEATNAIGGVFRSLNSLWVNHPESLVTAMFKPLQLTLANDCGMTTPKTLITNDPISAEHFFDVCEGQVIYKTLSVPEIQYAEVASTIYTSRLTKTDFSEAYRIKETACLFQEYIPKSLELRLTIVGDKIFCAEIYSQHSERSAVDWRRGYDDLAYGIHQLPDNISKGCRGLMRKLKLQFAAIDMIVRPDGEYVFIELNPSGQWAWIERKTKLPIRDALINLLKDGNCQK